MDDLVVVLEGLPAGVVTTSADGSCAFVYRDESPDATPLSLSMPRSASTHTGDTVRDWLEGLLPQDPRLRQRWASRVHVSGSAGPERLLGAGLGWDCPGAVQFAWDRDLDDMLARPAGLEPVAEADIATELRRVVADHAAGRPDAAASRAMPAYSLAGTQPKIALARHRSRWCATTGAEPTTHILKPAPAGIDDQPFNEHYCLAIARNLGLDAAASSIGVFEDVHAVVLERFDRASTAAGVRRLHQEDACQALGRAPDTRAEALGGVSTVHIAELLRAHGAQDHLGELVDRLALSWALGLIDGHGKNTSLMLSGSSVALAPLYDLASGLPYASDGADTYLAMHIGDQPALGLIGPADWEHHARRLDLPAGFVRERVARIVEATADAAAAAADEPPPSAEAAAFADRLAGAVADWQQHCLNALARTSPRPGRTSASATGSALGTYVLA